MGTLSPGIEEIRTFLKDSGWFDAPPVERRALTLEQTAAVVAPPGTTAVPGVLGGRPAEWLLGGGMNRDKVVLYLHGGGYVSGAAQSHRDLIGRLALAAGCPVVLVEYRLAPEEPFPAALDDALAAYRELLSERPAGHIALAGDSAGGGLALALLLALKEQAEPLPCCAALMSPWTDLTQTSASIDTWDGEDPVLSRVAVQQMADAYLAGHDPKDPAVSPLYGELVGLPPLLVHIGEVEILHDDATGLVERAKVAGVDATIEEWPGMIHVFQSFPLDMVPEGEPSVTELGAFIAAHL